MHTFIRLNSGKKFDFLNFSEDDVCIEDIAHSLSLQTRFAGHCKVFYSIAEHSVRGSSLVPKELALSFLLHDAAEAYTGDVTSPLKRLIPEFLEIEEKINNCIKNKFGLADISCDEVKKIDLTMLATEMRDLMRGDDWKDLPHKPNHHKIVPWKPWEARSRFLSTFHFLNNQGKVFKFSG